MEKRVQFKQTKITLTKLFFSSLSSWFYKVNINEDWHIRKTLRLRLIGSRSDQSDRDNLITLLQTSRDPIIIPRSPFLNPYIMINVLHCTTVHCFGMIIHIVKPRPKSKTPKAQPQPSQIQSKSVPKGLGLTLKSYGPPPHPITFKHEGGL